MMFSFVRLQKQAQITAILDLFGEDSWRNVYAGELEVRPPPDRIERPGQSTNPGFSASYSKLLPTGCFVPFAS